MAEAKPVVKPQASKKSGDKVKVKNVSNHDVNLTHGVIEKSNEGTATVAELTTLGGYLEKV